MATQEVSLEQAFTDHLAAGGSVDPHPLYRRLRETKPVFKTPSGFWFITSFELAALYYQLDRDKNSAWTKDASKANESADMGALTSGAGMSAKFFASEIHHRDGEDHARLRRLMNKPFSPKAVADLRPDVRTVIESMVDDLLSRESRSADLVADLALRIPTRIIMDLLGVPDEHYNLMVEIATIVIASHEPGTSNWAERADTAFARGHDVLLDLVEERRVEPRNDLLTAFAALRDQPGPTMSDLELTMNLMFLLVAGHETTANSIASGAHDLLTHPDQLRLLRNEPLLLESAVEETLRYRPPVRMASPRWAVADMEFGGEQIKKGDEVKISILAANRDPAVFDDPDTLDIRRSPNRHLSFAAGSTHYCLGAVLARMEIQECMRALLDRAPTLEVDAEGVRWGDSFVVQGPSRLPVSW